MKKIIGELLFCTVVISSFIIITSLISPLPKRKSENKHSNSGSRKLYFQSKDQD